MLELRHFVDERDTTYPTANDFCESFNDEMNSLYRLSFLLTADSDKAEQCFIDGLGECVEGNGAFMNWARSGARRAIIRHAIQMIMPAPEEADNSQWIRLKGLAKSAESIPFVTVLLLGAFERFVFIMSVLEGQSDAECALLLGCSQRDVMMARTLALKCQGGAGFRCPSKRRPPAGLSHWP